MVEKYYPLQKILNIYDSSEYENQFNLRFNSFSTYKFPLYINNFETQLFAVIDLDTIDKLDKIQKKLSKIRLINPLEKNNIFFQTISKPYLLMN